MMSIRWTPDLALHSEFLAPPTVVGGRGSIQQVAKLLGNQFGLSGGTVLVAADDAVINFGLAEKLLGSLEDAGFRVVLRAGFGTEPTAEVVDEAAEEARAAKAVAVVGIGGGSVLDSSKIISLLMRNAGGAADWLGVVDPENGVAPLILIPTTCGTGAEATRIAMVTVDGAKRASSCSRYVPQAAVIDPDLVASLPPAVVASTGMDALAHAIESLMATTASPLSAHHALGAIEMLIPNLDKAAEGDRDALAQCLWGSHLAGQALNAGVVLGHSLAYCLSYEQPMPHGTSCALALPYCLAYNQNLEPELASALARAITGGRSDDLRTAAQDILDLSKRLGLPTTLDEASIPKHAEASIAQRCVREYPRPTNPEPLEEAALERLVSAMRAGDLDAAFEATAQTVGLSK